MSGCFPAAAAATAGMANRSPRPCLEKDVAILSHTHAKSNNRQHAP